MKDFDLLIMAILLFLILFKPSILYDIYNTIFGKIGFIILIILVTMYKPYMGVLLFILLLSLNYI